MIRLSKFDLVAPVSVSEALDVLGRGNGSVKVLAGGTDLVVGMKQGISRPKQLVWLGKLRELQTLSFSTEQGLRLGAMCTLTDIERNDQVRQYYPSLVRAIRSIASPQIRNRATIGGNLCLNTRCFYYDQSEFWRGSLGFCLKCGDGICHAAPESDSCFAVFCSDLAPLLIALNATVTLTSATSQHAIPLSEMYRNEGTKHLAIQSSELLSQVSIPYSPQLTAVFAKHRRRGAVDFPLVNTAVSLNPESATPSQRIRIVIGAISSSPLEVSNLAQELNGTRATGKNILDVANEVAAMTRPMPNVEGVVSYRKKIVKVLVERSLTELLSRRQAADP